MRQRSLRSRASVAGVGLHSGLPARVTLVPAPANQGLVFVRTDLELRPEIPVRVDHVVSTRLATSLGAGVAIVHTVEHLLAALYALGVDNARIEVDGPELPILDGSARGFVELVRTAGIVSQRAPKRWLVVRKPVELGDPTSRWVRLEPAPRFEVRCCVDFDHPLITAQSFETPVDEASFVAELAPARTFGFGRDVEAMRSAGLALGGSLENAVVIDDFSVRNPEGLRFADEFARHKALDAVGDLALLGAPLLGRYVGVRSGHEFNVRLVAALLADPEAFSVTEPVVPMHDDVDSAGAISDLQAPGLVPA